MVLVALSCLLILGGCYYYFRVNGSGVLVERKLGYKDFLDLEVVIGADITFSPASDRRILLRADDNIIDLVTVYPDDGGSELRVDLDNSFRYQQVSVELEIDTDTIRSIYVDSHRSFDDYVVTIESGFTLIEPFSFYVKRGSALIEGISFDDGEFTVHNAKLTGAITADEVYIDCNEAEIDLSGTVNTLELNWDALYYSSTVDLQDLEVTTAFVNIGSGTTTINVSGSIYGKIRYDATVRYVDNPGLDLSGLEVGDNATLLVLPVD